MNEPLAKCAAPSGAQERVSTSAELAGDEGVIFAPTVDPHRRAQQLQQPLVDRHLVLVELIRMLERVSVNRMLGHDDGRRGIDARVAGAEREAHRARRALQDGFAPPR